MGINVRRIDRGTGQFGYGGDQIRRNNRNIFEPSLNSGHKKNRGGGMWIVGQNPSPPYNAGYLLPVRF
jgi:hypothetical protein